TLSRREGLRVGSEAAGDEAGIAETGLAVEKRRAVERRHAAAGGEEDGVAGGGVPFHRRAEARVEVGLAGGELAELDRAAADALLGDLLADEEGGEFLVVLVRAAVDDDEPVGRRTPRGDLLGSARSAPAPRRAGTGAGIGDTERRDVDHAEDRDAGADQPDVDGELAVAADELLGAVERVDEPEEIGGCVGQAL